MNRADGCSGDISILRGELLGIVPDKLKHRPQILQIQQQQAVVIGDLEHKVQHP